MNNNISGGISENTKYNTPSPAMLSALRTGDHSAFETIFMLYFEKVKRFINLLLKSEDLAEELSQEIFVNLWQFRDRIDPKRNFTSYLYTIARNAVYNYIKRKSVRDKFVNTAWSVDNVPDAEELVIAQEMELLVTIAVSRMPKQRRKIYEMSRTEGMTVEEIAVELRISSNAVNKQLRLAMDDIRDALALLAIIVVMAGQ